jgi:hypothetical protein
MDRPLRQQQIAVANSGLVADDADNRGRSQAPQRQDRLHVGAPHPGFHDDAPARAHDRAGWRDIARRYTLDRLPFQLPLAGKGTVAAVAPPDARDATRRARRRAPAVLRRLVALIGSALARAKQY